MKNSELKYAEQLILDQGPRSDLSLVRIFPWLSSPFSYCFRTKNRNQSASVPEKERKLWDDDHGSKLGINTSIQVDIDGLLSEEAATEPRLTQFQREAKITETDSNVLMQYGSELRRFFHLTESFIWIFFAFGILQQILVYFSKGIESNFQEMVQEYDGNIDTAKAI